MTQAQQACLAALGPHERTLGEVAEATGRSMMAAQHTLDALFRRSLVTITASGRWTATDRGLRRLAA